MLAAPSHIYLSRPKASTLSTTGTAHGKAVSAYLGSDILTVDPDHDFPRIQGGSPLNALRVVRRSNKCPPPLIGRSYKAQKTVTREVVLMVSWTPGLQR